LTHQIEHRTEQPLGRRDQIGLRPGVIAEVLFALLPISVIVVVLAHFRGFAAILTSPEISFGATVLFAQVLTKFTAGLSKQGKGRSGEVSLTMAVVMVFGLIPTVLVLFLMLECELTAVSPSRLLITSQVVLSVTAILVYILLGSVVDSGSLD
jgi:hypothetical protein